jgi:hypothetical protein
MSSCPALENMTRNTRSSPGNRSSSYGTVRLSSQKLVHSRTPIGAQEVVWHIVEHDRPHHAKLQAQDGTTITYTFIGKGDNTTFRREFELGWC